MKGIQGLVIAIFLGIIGAVFNLIYLNKGQNYEQENFISIKPGVKIARGKPIKKEHLAIVPIPSRYVGNLKSYAYPERDMQTIIGRKVLRNYQGGEMVLREDLRTPPARLTLVEKETAIYAPIDTRTAVTSQIIPKVTRVSFHLPKSHNPAAAKSSVEPWVWLGPFDILSVGNRLGSPDVMGTSNVSQQQRNIVALRATTKNGVAVPNIDALQNYLIKTQYAPLRVRLHAAKKDG